MIGILEQTYARHDHASSNAALIQAVALAFPDEDFLFASTAEQRGYVEEFRPLSPRTQYMDITVPPPGGVSVRRFAAQWRAIRGVIRRAKPHTCILLSSGPETFFAARAIVTEFSSVVLFIVLHGNLNDATGWRSRDPRRRFFDYRAGLAAARHDRIRLVVLEDYIRSVALRERLLPGAATFVWPTAFNECELADPVGLRTDGSPIRIAFLGSATKNKGFDKFLDLARVFDASDYEFRFIGSALEEFPEAALAKIEMPPGHLTREDFIRRLRDVDYVFTPYSEKIYEFSASGSLLDCISQTKPVISLDFAGVRELAERWGDIGFICKSMEQVKALLSRKADLSNPALYSKYQANLAAIRESRTPAGIAPLIRRALMNRGTGATAE